MILIFLSVRLPKDCRKVKPSPDEHIILAVRIAGDISKPAMLVSVVVPNLNKGQYLQECLESIIRQDYAEVEIIAVDGGSSDNSIEIFEKYRSHLSELIVEQDNGQAHAINKGFRKSSGEIVTWLNSDDIFLPDAINTVVETFTENPSLDLMYGNGLFIDERSRALRAFIEVEPYDRYRLLNCSDYIMQPTAFYRRRALEQIGYLDETLHFAFDWDLWCKLALLSDSVQYVQPFIAATRIYPSTKTASGSWTRLKEINHVLRRHRTRLLPPAIWGYLAYELESKRHSSAGPTKYLMGLLCWFCALLGIENTLHDRRLRHSGRAIDALPFTELPDGFVLPNHVKNINTLSPDEIRLRLLKEDNSG